MSGLPMYETIYRQLLKGIHDGTFAVGSRLPTEMELCERYAVSRITGKRAMDMLAQDGYIRRVKGCGSFVLRLPSSEREAADASGGVKLIGVVMSDFSESFGMRILYGIEEACRAHGCHFVLRRSGGDEEAERDAITSLRAMGVQGLAVMPVHGEYYNPVLLKYILEGFPVALMDRSLRGINASFVGTDNIASARAAARYLLEFGHRSIAWISPPPAHTSTLEDREDGFHEELLAHNIVPNKALWFQNVLSTLPTKNNPPFIAADIKALSRHFRKHPEITAAFASEYNVALLVREAALSVGLDVPRDLSILCFDSPENPYSTTEFTHIRQSECDMGRRVVDMIFTLIAERGVDEKKQTVTLDGELVAGRSTSAPRQHAVNTINPSISR